MRTRSIFVGIVAILIASPIGLVATGRTAAAACVVSAGGTCVGGTKVVETPIGPMVVGAEGVSPITALVTHNVATVEGHSCVVSAGGACAVPDVNTNGLPADGYGNGGCTNNATCSNLYLYWNDTGYWGSGQADDPWRGAASFNLLEPASPPNDGFEYDFADTLANVSANTWSVCSLALTDSSSTSASSPLSWWPTGGQDIPGSSSQSVSVSIAPEGVGMGYSATFNSSLGYLEGDVWADQNSDPNFSANWAYQDSNGNGASECYWNSVAMEGGIAFRTPENGKDYTISYSAGGSGYSGT